MGEHTKYQRVYIESVDGCAHQSAVDIIGILEQQRDELAEAICALGVIDSGYCFCSCNRDPDKSAHEIECADLRAAIAKVREG